MGPYFLSAPGPNTALSASTWRQNCSSICDRQRDRQYNT